MKTSTQGAPAVGLNEQVSNINRLEKAVRDCVHPVIKATYERELQKARRRLGWATGEVIAPAIPTRVERLKHAGFAIH